jgi:predicted MFS family arabinose efflux permease
MSASLSKVKADFLLSDFQGGMLFSSFVIPYIIFSLLLAYRADRTNRLHILKAGTLIWSASAVLTAFAQNYTQLILCRSLLGVGEAAFAAVAPAVIHHMCAPEKRGRLMALFTSGLPLGMALGFVGGGYITDNHGWRSSYLVLGIPAVIMSLIFLFSTTSEDRIPAQKIQLKEEIKSLLLNRQYMLLVLGYAAYMFVAGGVTHWMPTYIEKYHSMSLSMANAIFGGAAIGFGLLGTWVGGIFGDRLKQTREFGYIEISYISMALAVIPFVMTCFASSTIELIVWISLTQFLFFISNSPLTIATFQAVSVSQASFAMAVQIFVSHLLGDALSAPLIGKISDVTGNLRIGILLSAPVILIGATLWFWPLKKPAPTAIAQTEI